MEFEDKLLAEMEKSDIFIEGTINWATDEFQRFSSKNHWNRKRHLFVVLFHGGASFGDWRDPVNWKTVWEKSWKELSFNEKRAREEHVLRLKREKELLRAHAIWRAELFLSHQTFLGPTCKEASQEHFYIISKRIIPYGAYQCRSYLILPIHDINGALQSLQYIKKDGFKRFKKHASPKNGFILLGDKIITKDDTLWICEGWATGCSIYETINQPVVCSLGASNMESVAYQLRLKYPENRMVICADNDAHLPENIGVVIATKAAKNSGSLLRIPNFDNFSSLNKKLTDWNDLFCIAGIEETEKQLLNLRI
jgi:putative DNA primase/helicase